MRVAGRLPVGLLLMVAGLSSGQQYNTTQLWTCDASSATQIWTVDTHEPYPFAHIYLSKTFNSTTNIALVLDVEGWSNNTGATVWTSVPRPTSPRRPSLMLLLSAFPLHPPPLAATPTRLASAGTMSSGLSLAPARSRAR